MGTIAVRRIFGALLVGAVLLSLITLRPLQVSAAGGPLVYGINPFANSTEFKGLRPFDAATGLNAPGFVMTIIGGPISGTIRGGNGLAVDPTSGIAYAVLNIQGRATRVLATIDLTNGQATTIAETGLRIAAITFGPDGTLFAVNGTQSDSEPPVCSSCLYELSVDTGQPIGPAIMQLTDVGGHAIAYNTSDDLLYHATGRWDAAPGDRVFETVDPLTQTTNEIGYIGAVPDEVIGMGYEVAHNRFIISDLSNQVWSVTPSGHIALLNPISQSLRGLAVTTNPVPPNVPPTANDDVLPTVRDGESQFVNVLENDSDPEEDPISIASFTPPANGSLTEFSTGFSYTPDEDYCNDGGPTDNFTYTLNGGDVATVAVTVMCLHRTLYGFSSTAFLTVERTFGSTLDNLELDVVSGPLSDEGSSEGLTLAIQPKTGRAFVTANVNPTNEDIFGTLDIATGEIAAIVQLPPGLEVAAMAFGGGVLYAVSSSDSSCGSCLFTIDKKTGARKRVLGPGKLADDGSHGLAFNPEDGMLYHAADNSFERIDPKRDHRVTAIGYTGTKPSFVTGLGFDEITGTFVMLENGNLFELTPEGVATDLDFSVSLGRGLVVGALRTVSLGYSSAQRRFSGVVASPEDLADGCTDGIAVSIYRVRRGADPLIGQVVTGSDGTFEHQGKARPGKYYATVDAEVTVMADCRSARSKNERVR